MRRPSAVRQSLGAERFVLLFPEFPLLLLLLLLLLRPLLLLLLFWVGHWVCEFCAALPDWFPKLVLPEAALVEVKE